MGQKFFISFNSADRDKAHWIAWTLKEAGHEVAVHDWEIPAGGNAPLWMNSRLAWADRLIAILSPDYVPARYSPMEWASQIWNDPDGTKGSVIPVIVRPTSEMPPLLRGLSRIDLTNCSEDEASRRLIQSVNMPAPPERKPAFEKIEGEPPDSQHAGPTEKPTFVNRAVAGDNSTIVQVYGDNNYVNIGARRTLTLYQFARDSSQSPASKLSPYNRGCRFVGRDSELSSIAAWLDRSAPISVRTLTGQAGLGKTRLAIEATNLALGWTTGFVTSNELRRFVESDSLGRWDWDKPTFVVVDYAEQKAEALSRWISDLSDRLADAQHLPQAKLRILILERYATPNAGWFSDV